jgi:hypothetical protein
MFIVHVLISLVAVFGPVIDNSDRQQGSKQGSPAAIRSDGQVDEGDEGDEAGSFERQADIIGGIFEGDQEAEGDEGIIILFAGSEGDEGEEEGDEGDGDEGEEEDDAGDEPTSSDRWIADRSLVGDSSLNDAKDLDWHVARLDSIYDCLTFSYV